MWPLFSRSAAASKEAERTESPSVAGSISLGRGPAGLEARLPPPRLSRLVAAPFAAGAGAAAAPPPGPALTWWRKSGSETSCAAASSSLRHGRVGWQGGPAGPSSEGRSPRRSRGSRAAAERRLFCADRARRAPGLFSPPLLPNPSRQPSHCHSLSLLARNCHLPLPAVSSHHSLLSLSLSVSAPTCSAAFLLATSPAVAEVQRPLRLFCCQPRDHVLHAGGPGQSPRGSLTLA